MKRKKPKLMTWIALIIMSIGVLATIVAPLLNF